MKKISKDNKKLHLLENTQTNTFTPLAQLLLDAYERIEKRNQIYEQSKKEKLND